MNKFVRYFSKRSSWSLPYFIFLLLFVVLPLLLIVFYAFRDNQGHFTVDNFVKFVQQKEALNTFIYSVGIAIVTTLLCILFGYPAAYILSNSDFNKSKTTVMLFILPMWVNFLIRTLATVTLFDITGLQLGQGALMFGLTYDFLPFMIYPIYNTMMKIDKSLIEAAQDLGASRAKVFTKVIFPLSLPGVLSGVLMVFLPTISTFAISELLTMNDIQLFGSVIQTYIMQSDTMNYGAALSLIMLLIIGITSLFTGGDAENESPGLI